MPLIPFRHSMFELFDDEFESMLAEFRKRHPMKADGFIPQVDVYERGKDVIVEAPLAGVDPKDVEVAIDGQTLTLRGKKEHKKEVDEKDYYHKEVRYGVFARTVHLPVPVLADKAEAVSEHGVLKVTLPKAAPRIEGKSLKIEVRGEKPKKKK